MFDPGIERYKTTVMQRIQQAASRGYVYFIQGYIPLNKVTSFAEKMNDRYDVGANENRRAYKKRKGLANTRLFLYPIKDEQQFRYWLLATEGEGAVHVEEKLHKIFDVHHRISFHNDYELVPVTKKGTEYSTTWRMTRQHYKEWHERVRSSVRNPYTDEFARQSLWSLNRVPGFAGIRVQAKSLLKVFHAEWKRSKHHATPLPPSKALGYVRGLKENTTPLSTVVRRLAQGRRPFPNIKTGTPITPIEEVNDGISGNKTG